MGCSKLYRYDKKIVPFGDSCRNFHEEMFFKISSNFLNAILIYCRCCEGLLFLTYTPPPLRWRKEIAWTDHYYLGSSDCDCTADIKTPVTEVESTATQTTKTPEVGEDKGTVRKFVSYKEITHLLWQYVWEDDAHRASHGKMNDSFD